MRNPYYRPRPILDGINIVLEPSSTAVEELPSPRNRRRLAGIHSQ